MREGDLAQAENLLMTALRPSESLGEARFIAYAKQRLAEVYLATGRVQLARQLASEALDVFERLDMRQKVTQTADLLSRIG